MVSLFSNMLYSKKKKKKKKKPAKPEKPEINRKLFKAPSVNGLPLLENC